MTEADESPKVGWVLYDASCGFCSWWIPFWQRTLERAGYSIAPLQAPWVQQELDVPPERQIDDLRLLLSDGTRIDGADVYLHVMRRIWWTIPAAYVFRLPGLYRVFRLCYRVFNRNRFLISKTCRLPPEMPAAVAPKETKA